MATGPSIDFSRDALDSDETSYRANLTGVDLLIGSSVPRSLLDAPSHADATQMEICSEKVVSRDGIEPEGEARGRSPRA